MADNECYNQRRQCKQKKQIYENESFWLDFKHGVSDWNTNDAELMFDSENVKLVHRNCELEVAKKRTTELDWK